MDSITNIQTKGLAKILKIPTSRRKNKINHFGLQIRLLKRDQSFILERTLVWNLAVKPKTRISVTIHTPNQIIPHDTPIFKKPFPKIQLHMLLIPFRSLIPTTLVLRSNHWSIAVHKECPLEINFHIVLRKKALLVCLKDLNPNPQPPQTCIFYPKPKYEASQHHQLHPYTKE